MTNITELSTPEAELNQSQENAIFQYQWIESQRAGTDIGRERASREWFEKHFTDWAKAERRAIDQLLTRSRPSSGPRGRR